MVINFFGKRGSGKTTVIKGQLGDCRPPIIIIDILGNYNDSSFIQKSEIADTILEIKKYYQKDVNKFPGQTNDPKTIINLATSDYNLAVDYISACLWEIKGGTLILDEVDCFDISEAPCFDENIRYGRNHNVDIITGCRRPAELSRNITAAANKFYCFGTHEPRDIDYFRDIFGERAFELMRMPKYSGLFLDYDNELIGRFKVDSAGGIHHTKADSIGVTQNASHCEEPLEIDNGGQQSEGDEPSQAPEMENESHVD